MTDREKVIDKVRKLLALSQSSNENEAALAAERAQDLMLKHGFQEHELGEEIEDPQFSEVRVDTKLHGWMKILAWHVSESCGGKCFYTQSYGSKSGSMTFVGQGDTAQMMSMLYDSIVRDLENVYEIEYAKEPIVYDDYGRRVNGQTRRISWMLGAVQTLGRRLQKRKATFDQHYNPQALVVHRDALKKHMERYSLGKAAGYDPNIDRGSMDAGKATGSKIGFGDSNLKGQRHLGA